MRYFIQTYQLTIAMTCIAMVVMTVALTGCRGCASEEEKAHWIPAPREATPGVAVQDSTDTILPVEEESSRSSAASSAVLAAPHSAKNKTAKTASRVQGTNSLCLAADDTHLWTEVFAPDQVQLTIVFSDIEIQITKGQKEQDGI